MRAARLLLLLSCLPLAAAAQDFDEQRLPLWEAGLTGRLSSGPAYPGSDTRAMRVLALPFVYYRGKVFHADESGAGARLVRSDAWELDLGFAGALPPRGNGVPAREGMPNLGTLVEFGPRARITLARPTATSQLRLDLPLRTVIEARGGLRGRGWTFEPKLALELHETPERWGMDVHGSVLVGDAQVNHFFYDVAPQYVTPTRPAYQAKAGLMTTRLGVGVTHRLGADLRLHGSLNYDSYVGSANLGSPLNKSNGGVSIGIGLAWTLARSGVKQ
ncbi:MAG: MipA/OmpV family protein [Pseudomonadota bacterium]